MKVGALVNDMKITFGKTFMKVRVKTTVAGPKLDRPLQPGEVADVEEEFAKDLIKGGFAEDLKEAKVQAVAVIEPKGAKIETADEKDPETPEKGGRKKKGARLVNLPHNQETEKQDEQLELGGEAA